VSFVAAFPPPYRRMLAFNSDIEFTTWRAQLDLFRLFGERGLETAFSYWLFSDPTYTWRMLEANGSWSKEAPIALQLARGGLLDTLHSFGGAAHIGGIHFDREDIRRGYAKLADWGVRTTVYSNHGTDRDVQNIGGTWAPPRVEPIDFKNYWAGDLTDHPVYHLDLTLEYGMRYFWLDIDRARHRGWFDGQVDSAGSDLFTTQVSRDASPILRFKRTDLNQIPWPTTLASQLDSLLSDPASGFSIIYNHFGFMRSVEDKPVPNPAPYFNDEAYAQIDRLVEAQRSGDVLVTTTSRLLNYALLQTARPWAYEETDERIVVRFKRSIQVGAVALTFDWPDFMGFAIALDHPKAVELWLGGEKRTAERWSCANTEYAGIPWRPLKMMDLLDDALRTHA